MSTQPILARKITMEQRRRVIGLTLYSAADIPFSVSHDGVPYTIPPDGPSKERFDARDGISTPGLVKDDGGEYAIYDGTLTVYDRYGVTKEAAVAYRKALRSNRGRRTPTKPEANKLIAGADAIASHIERKLGKSGVTLLYGTEDEIAALKRTAREKNLKFKVDQVDRILKNYRERTATFHSDIRNRGSYAPSMDEHESAAQIWKDAYKDSTARARFVCPENCGFQHNEEAVMDRHVRSAHPMTADSQTEPEKPAPKPPPPVQAPLAANTPPPRLAPSR